MIVADEAHKHMSKGAVVTHGAVMVSDSNGRIFSLLYCKCHVSRSRNNNHFYFIFQKNSAEQKCCVYMFVFSRA